MNKTRLFLYIFAVILVIGCRPSGKTNLMDSPASTSLDLESRIRRVENGLVKIYATGQPAWGQTFEFTDRMAHYQVPGVSIAVIDDYQIEWAKGYGVLKAGGDQPVTANTLFHAGSVAKVVSAAATLTLVERGMLDLDEDVNERLVSWQIPENKYTVEEKVTLRRLLSHSAGIEDGFTNRSSSDSMPAYIVGMGEAPAVTLIQLLNGDPSVDVDGPTRVTMVPGTAYRYANADYVLVELLVEDVTEQPFGDLLREIVLDPLEMTSSTIEKPLPEDFRTRATVEHDVNGEPFPGERGHFPMVAAGGLWTNPSDLASFAIEIMRTYQGQSEAILSPEMVREMLTPQIEGERNPLYDATGLGPDLKGDGRGFRFMHTGGTWGSTCILWAYPETGQGVVIMTNSASGEGMIRFEILLSIAAEYGWLVD